MRSTPLGLCALACAFGTLPSQQAAQPWTISERPLVSIGADGADTLILRSTSALRLANGTIVVASNRDSKLQWFDATGRHIKSVGRRGQGPEEFSRGIYLYQGAGDTIVAHDEGARRFHYLSPTGEFLRLDRAGDTLRAAWAYNRTAVYRMPGRADHARIMQTLARIPFTPRDTVRHARVDYAGNVWMESPTDPSTFSVYSPDARLLGRLTVPPSFNVYQILDTLVLGHWRDEDGVEHIQIRRLTRGPPPAAGALRAGTSPPPYNQMADATANRNIVSQMAASINNLRTAQELHYSSQRRYAATPEDLMRHTWWVAPPELKVTFFRAQPNSYSVLIEHLSTRITCFTAQSSRGWVCG